MNFYILVCFMALNLIVYTQDETFVVNTEKGLNLINAKGEILIKEDFQFISPKWNSNDYFLIGSQTGYSLANNKGEIILKLEKDEMPFFINNSKTFFYSISRKNSYIKFYDLLLKATIINLKKDYSKVIPNKDKVALIFFKGSVLHVDVYCFETSSFIFEDIKLATNNKFKGRYFVSIDENNQIKTILDCTERKIVPIDPSSVIDYLSNDDIYVVGNYSGSEILFYYNNLDSPIEKKIMTYYQLNYYDEIVYKSATGDWLIFKDGSFVKIDEDPSCFFKTSFYRIFVNASKIKIYFNSELNNTIEVDKSDYEINDLVFNDQNICLRKKIGGANILNQKGEVIMKNKVFFQTRTYYPEYDKFKNKLYEVSESSAGVQSRNKTKSDKIFILNDSKNFKILSIHR
jgi:hypothetical protein